MRNVGGILELLELIINKYFLQIYLINHLN
jgi:hypothetical protein